MWNLDYTKKHILKIYSDFNSHDTSGDGIIIDPPIEESTTISQFDIIESKNTQVIDDSYGDQSLTLDFKDKIINIIVDNSGSMSWNDNSSLRLDIIKDFINNLSGSYPENIGYNIVKFGGKKIKFSFSAAFVNDNPFSYDFNINVIFPQDAYVDKVRNIYGMRVLRKEGSFSDTPIDGEIVYDGMAVKILDSGLIENNDYYYSVYTYDENFHFSDPTQVIITPRQKIIPKGIRNFNNEVLVGSSVVVDSNIKSVWHFEKNEDEILYDFSANRDLQISSLDPYWINKNEVPIGVNGLRFDGVNDNAWVLDNYNFYIYSVPFSIMGWVYPFDSSGSDTPIAVRTNGADIDWGLYLDSNKIRFNVGGNIFDSVGGVIDNEWNHIGITIDISGNLTFYINGTVAGTAIVPTISSYPLLDDMFLVLASDFSNFFHGYLTEFSIHDIDRDINYISKYSMESIATDRDNGDRLIIFKYSISDMSDLMGGAVYVVKNDFSSPSNEQDGEIIFYNAASLGEFYTTYREDFVAGKIYNFRIFSKNSIGNYSDIFDSLNLSVQIPSISSEAFQNINAVKNLDFPQNYSIFAGDNKNYIQWDYANNSDAKRVLIYYSTSSFPIIDNGDISGDMIYDGEAISGYFVHDELINNQEYYYSLFTIDRYQRTSDAINLIGKPLESNSNLDIPTSKIEGLSYEIVSKNSINIFWKDPTERRIIDGYFDDNIILFAKITDEYNNILDEDLDVSLNISVVKTITQDAAEDIFSGETLFVIPDDNQLYQAILSNMEHGFSDGLFLLKMKKLDSQESLLKNIDKIEVTIVPTFSIKNDNGTNIFEYTSLPIKLRLKNPFSVNFQNANNQTIEVIGKKEILELGNRAEEIKIYNGAYINASRVFVLRSLFSYRGASNLGPDSISMVMYNAQKDIFSDDIPIPINQNTILDSTTGIIYSETNNIEQLDYNGNATGEMIYSKYADINIKPPAEPTKLLVYIKAVFGGFSFVKKMFVLFDGILKIDLSPSIPIINGIDIAEQFANVYILDPDNPKDITKRIYLPNNTIVKWDIVKTSESAIDRTLFSTDSVPIANGIYSYVNSGVAGHVFLGPLADVKILEYRDGQPVYESHVLSASVIYNGISAIDSYIISLSPLSSKNQEIVNSYFLLEFENLKQQIYDDGVDYARATISHNANASTTKYSDCFRECMLSLGKNIYELVPGQLVFISAEDPNVEIIWGDVIEETDPYTGQRYLNTDNAHIDLGSAYVELSDGDHTYVYFRINYVVNGSALNISGSVTDVNSDSIINEQDIDLETNNIKNLILFASFFGKSSSEIIEGQVVVETQYAVDDSDIKPLCDCIREQKTIVYKNEIVISGSISSIFNGKMVSLSAGGDMTAGLPSTILIPRESLNLYIVDKKVNNISVNNIAIDGTSENEIILDVSHSGIPVAEGTPVFCQVVNYGDPVLNVISSINYTTNFIYSDFSSDMRSYVSIKLQPIPKNETFKSELYVVFSYDLGDSINRIKILKLRFYFDAEDTLNNSTEIFSRETYRIDLLGSSNWEKMHDIDVPRSHFVCEAVNNKIYIIGGINSNLVLGSVEEYDPITDVYITKTEMPTRRFAASSCVDGNYIYVFGGIEYDVEHNKLFISRVLERYDVLGDTWISLESMPFIEDTATGSSYGNAFGVSKIISGEVYILSGIRDISFDGRVYILNDRILIYSILVDNWSYSDVVDTSLESYKRMSPYSFEKNNKIYVLGGFSSKDNISTDCYNYDVVSGTIEISDNSFITLPIPKYKSSFCSYLDNIYLIGGSCEEYNYSRDFNILNFSGVIFNSSVGNPLTYGLNMCGCSVVNDGISNYLYVIGGQKSGKGTGFLLIKSTLGSNILSLNNKQGVNLNITLVDESGDLILEDIDVKVYGYIQFYNATEPYIISRKLTKYPVVISPNQLTLIDGEGSVNIIPRADDILNEISSYASFNEQIENIRYKIILQVSILDNIYYGKNFVAIIDNLSDIPIIGEVSSSDINNNTFVEELVGDTYFILSDKMYQNDAPIVNCASDSYWIPLIEQITDDVVDKSSAITAINTIEDPIGSSPMLDAIQLSSIILSKIEYDGKDKIFTIFCDDEYNSSVITLVEATDAILNISGSYIPAIIANLSLLQDIDQVDATSIIGTDVYDYNSICNSTGGQSLTFNNINDINNYVEMVIGGVVGSPGFGDATCIFDLDSVVDLRSVSPDFYIPIGCDGKWSAEFSKDKYNFSSLTDWIETGGAIDVINTNARYIKIYFRLFSGLPFNLPYVLNVSFNFVKPKTDYIFVDSEYVGDELKEIVASTLSNGNRTDIFNLENGVSLSSGSYNWEDFANGSFPSKDKAGKFIIPKRRGTLIENISEPLIRIDGFLYKATYGSWDEGALVSIYDLSNNEISDVEYLTYPRYGEIIFKKKKYENFIINITNQDVFRIGNKITNSQTDKIIEIFGWGFMYKKV